MIDTELQGTPVSVPDARIAAILGHTGFDRAFLADRLLRNMTVNGVEGFGIEVRLTSYRSLPLSCIAGLTLSVDREEHPADTLTLILDGAEYPFPSLPSLSNIWWFILDVATLFVPKPNGLEAGEHQVEGTLVTVEPYLTAGRISFYSSASKRLVLEEI